MGLLLYGYNNTKILLKRMKFDKEKEEKGKRHEEEKR